MPPCSVWMHHRDREGRYEVLGKNEPSLPLLLSGALFSGWRYTYMGRYSSGPVQKLRVIVQSFQIGQGRKQCGKVSRNLIGIQLWGNLVELSLLDDEANDQENQRIPLDRDNDNRH